MSEKAPLWCANDEPHKAHRERNEFNDWNECTGRPEVSDSGEYVPTLEGWLKLMFPNSWLEVRERLTANNAAVREAAQREVVEMLRTQQRFASAEAVEDHFNLNQTGVTE